jgi:hypothetical protein
MCHDSQNLLDDATLCTLMPPTAAFVGAVLSPVNDLASETEAFMKRFRMFNPDFRFILDPQLYFPESERGVLRQWDYFPKTFESDDKTSFEYWSSLTERLIGAGTDLRVKAIASPAFLPKIYDNEYFELMAQIGSELARRANDRFEPMQSLIVPLRDLAEPNKALKIASIISETKCPSIYLLIESGVDPREEIAADELLNLMQLISSLERAGLRVLVAYSSSDVLLWKAAGATAAATGKYFNVRRFTKSRFEPKKDKGGNLPYWFEESLLAFIRQDDLIRLHKEGLLCSRTMKHPLFKGVLSAIEQGEPWLKMSWLQYMGWFAGVERALHTKKITANTLLTRADSAWAKLRERKVFLSDGQEGTWVRRWLQADMRFSDWKTQRGS